MFTGIVEEVGRVERIGSGSLTILAKKVLEDAHLGDSIAVNGVCLTVTGFSKGSFTADVMPETFRRSALGELRRGSLVNLERALSLTSRLGGHIVSGHIDGVGRILSLKDEKNAVLMRVSAGPELLRYIVEKGSVALDGISLTVAAVTVSDFTVSLIPHTRSVTSLAEKREGDTLNIETDVIGKYVEKMLSPSPSGPKEKSTLTRAFLLENGF